MKIVKSQGLNEAEEILSKICDDTFLKLWSYPNPYKKQGDELCDVLVIFENYILIFSVKDIKFNLQKDVNIAWQRWKNKAIDESIKQVERAENWIKQNPDKIFLNAQCTQKLPIKIDIENCIFHRIIVAHGAEEACKKDSSNNIFGSLAIAYMNDNDFADIPSFTNSPFMITLPKDKVFHILDSFNFDIILKELDTINDIIWYFESKEKTIKQVKCFHYCGEEDALAFYWQELSNEGNHYIYVPKESDNKIVSIVEGEWSNFIKSESYSNKKQADEISYTWDYLLQKTFQNALNGTLLGETDVFNKPSPLKEMAKEPRFQRRILSDAMISSITRARDKLQRGENVERHFSVYVSYYEDKAYVFLQLACNENWDYETEYRNIRRYLLDIACGVTKIKYPHLKMIVGIAIDAPNFSKNTPKSEDFMLFNCAEWSEEDNLHYKKLNNNVNFFETDDLQITHKRYHEFPTSETNNIIKKKNKIGRNDICLCGSGVKYKKCCMQ